MKDRFKFRFWNKIHKRMENWHGCLFWEAFKNENLIPMQCTGLKDENGTLIYEGDIVDFWLDELYYKMKIVWDYDEFDFKAIGLKKSVERYEDHYQYLGCIKPKETDLEVIGNIYENKELLGKNYECK